MSSLRRDALVEHPRGLVDEDGQGTGRHETGGVAGRDDRLPEALGEDASPFEHVRARGVTRDELDERHLEDRIKEMDPDQAAGVRKVLPDRGDGEGGGVGREESRGVARRLDLREDFRLRIRSSGAASMTIWAESALRSPIATSIRPSAASRSPGPTFPRWTA